MKSLLVIAIGTLGLSFGDFELKRNHIQPNQMVITSIGSTMSYEPGQVSILGRGFELVTQVKVDGRVVPVVCNTGTEIVIQPAVMDPGFYMLEVVRPGMRVTGTIEFAPTIRGARFGNALRLVVNPGESGQIFVQWSYRCLDVPAIVPGVYYMQMLDLTTPRSGALSWAISRTGEPVVITAPVPAFIGGMGWLHVTPGARASGTGVHLQAFCIYDGDMCFTNMTEVPYVREVTPVLE